MIRTKKVTINSSVASYAEESSSYGRRDPNADKRTRECNQHGKTKELDTKEAEKKMDTSQLNIKVGFKPSDLEKPQGKSSGAFFSNIESDKILLRFPKQAEKKSTPPLSLDFGKDKLSIFQPFHPLTNFH